MTKKRAEALRWTAALAACLLAAMLSGGPAAAAEAAKNKGESKSKSQSEGKSQSGGFNKQDPIYITSDRMEADRQKNVLVYVGQVVAIQADMTLRSDKLTTYFDPDLQQIKQAVAEGKQVRMTQGDRVAIGTKAVFDGVTQTLTMTGCPILRQGNSEVSGDKITYSMADDRMTVESGKQCKSRVEVTLFPEELQQKKDGEAKKPTENKAK